MESLGKYQIMERLGQGGMSVIYHGYHPGLDRHVAIKVLHNSFADDPEFRARFNREAQHIARLNHPNIVQVYDVEYDPQSEKHFMVMELLEGKTVNRRLHDLAKDNQHMPLAEALHIIREAANALSYAHSQHLIHRDIKPLNLMIKRDGHVVLTDFGIAKRVAGEQSMTAGAMVGTPAYMAPEQCMGQVGDERTDLYSLGAIFYEILTGEPPFKGESPMETILKQLNAPIPSVLKFRPELPTKVDQLITKLLAKKPEDRYQSAADLLNALDSVYGNRIFISYRRSDWSAFVEPLIEKLKTQNLSWWVDQHLIEGGDDWLDEINAALRECEAMILCISPEALESRHVKLEYRYFFNNNKPIYPLICKQPHELPAELQIIQHYPYDELDKLIQQIKSQSNQI